MAETVSENLVAQIAGGLLQWYDFKRGAKVLYLGKREDIWLAGLDAEKLQVTVAKVCDIMNGNTAFGKFDYIICVECLERSADMCGLLRALHEHLCEDGHLLLGMNNRLGIRYFCGDRDPYTNRNFDGIENYCNTAGGSKQAEQGRCYSKSEIAEFLVAAGFCSFQFFSVVSDLRNPSLIYADGYVPNEDLTSRVFPTYHYPKSVFLEEEALYNTLVKEGLLHTLCNAFLIECSKTGELSDVLQVTSSMERGSGQGFYTVIRKGGTVEKLSASQDAKLRLQKMAQHDEELRQRGIRVVDSRMEDGKYIMPYYKDTIGQVYLKKLLRTDRAAFFQAMDVFRDLIFQSSELAKEDIGDGNGAVLKKAYLDMVPLNSFYSDGTFIFFDQEFCVENYPANVMLWRMIASFYFKDAEIAQLLPMDVLLERYGIKENLGKWQQLEFGFIDELRKTKELSDYHKTCWRDENTVRANRFRLNYSEEEYHTRFVDIFSGIDGKKLILFGAGAYAKDFLARYRFDYPVDLIVDNNRENCGTELNGVLIVPPEELKTFPKNTYKLIICVKDYPPIMKQLDEMGIENYSIYERGRSYAGAVRCAQKSVDGGGSNIGKKYHIGYVAGAFDMFHIGHVNLLRKAKAQCDYLIVGVLSDQGIYNLKNKYPVIPAEDRVAVIKACKYADLVEELPVDKMSIRDAYATYRFDAQFSGDDHATDAGWLSEQAYLRERGSDIVFFDYTQKVSSSKLREQLQKA